MLTQAPDLNNKLYKESLFIQELNNAKINSFPVMITDLKHRFPDSEKTEQKPKGKIKNISLDFTSLKDIFDCPYRFSVFCIWFLLSF